jgi:hypothetical protein
MLTSLITAIVSGFLNVAFGTVVTALLSLFAV